MMRLNEYILSEVTKAVQLKIDKFDNDFAPLIEKNCKQILTFYKQNKKFLYRGIDQKADFIEKEMRTGTRIPRNTDKKTHIRLNKLMKDKFGWKVRDGISVSSAEHQAIFYGNSYIFFPFDGYKFVYSKSLFDLFRSVKTQPIGMSDKEWEPKEMRSLKILVNKHQDDDLAGAFSRDGEILFKVKKYYLLSTDLSAVAEKKWGI